MPEITFNDRPHKNEKQESIDYVKSLIEQAREEAREQDILKLEKLIQLLNSKKYGLVWEEHGELVEEEMKTKIPVFVEDENKKISDNPNSENYNFLLEGDNLHSLHLLEKTHAGKIDVIYIDPPYNTGNKDFKYNDAFVDKTDTFSHSKWLSFMERRLTIAKRLLADDGVIFISIDDNEQGQLKMLMDEVFGEQNFINCICIKAKASSGASGGGEDRKLKKNIEYLLAYSKSDSFRSFKTLYKRVPLNEYIREREENKKNFAYKSVLVDKGVELYLTTVLAGNGKPIELYKIKNYLVKSVSQIMKEEKISQADVYEKYIDKIFTLENAQTSIRGRVINGAGNDDDFIIAKYVPVSGKNKGTLSSVGFMGKTKRLVSYLKPLCVVDGKRIYKEDKLGTLWDDLSWSSVHMEGKVSFQNGKKPIELIKRIVSLNESKNVTVLDFFAGSGSTGHAVLDLNSEDDGNRKFILATNNEVIETTYQRMKNVSHDLPMNLKYFKTDFIVRENFPDVSLEYELLKYITPLVELEFAVDITNPKVQIVLNEEQLEALIKNDELVSNSTLFMHPDVFRDAEQNQVLSDLQIKIQEIPDYFFGGDLWNQ